MFARGSAPENGCASCCFTHSFHHRSSDHRDRNGLSGAEVRDIIIGDADGQVRNVGIARGSRSPRERAGGGLDSSAGWSARIEAEGQRIAIRVRSLDSEQERLPLACSLIANGAQRWGAVYQERLSKIERVDLEHISTGIAGISTEHQCVIA